MTRNCFLTRLVLKFVEESNKKRKKRQRIMADFPKETRENRYTSSVLDCPQNCWIQIPKPEYLFPKQPINDTTMRKSAGRQSSLILKLSLKQLANEQNQQLNSEESPPWRKNIAFGSIFQLYSNCGSFKSLLSSRALESLQ